MAFKILATIFILNIPVLVTGIVGFAITDNYCLHKANKIFKRITMVSGIIFGLGGTFEIFAGVFGLVRMIWS